MKIGLFYSVFCQNYSNPNLNYVICCCERIQEFNLNALLMPKIDFIICTDVKTKSLIEQICRQENINYDFVIFKVFNENKNLNGMLWRYDALYNINYDITVIAEIDWDISYYVNRINYILENHNSCVFMVQNNKNPLVSDRFIAGGLIFCQPKKINDVYRNQFINDINFMLSKNIGYGIDEIYIGNIFKKFLTDYAIVFNIELSCKLNDDEGINDFNFKNVKDYLLTVFKQCKILRSPSCWKFTKKLKTFKINTDNKKYYLNGKLYDLYTHEKCFTNDFSESDVLNLVSKWKYI